MVSFVGEYARQLDDRGRFVLPAKIRENSEGIMYISRSPADKCLNLYTEEEWSIISEKVRGLSSIDRNVLKFQRKFFGKATLSEIDKQGRISLSEELMSYAGLKKDIVLVGMNNRLEIWDSESWKNAVSDDDDDDIMLEGVKSYGINL